MKKFIFTSLFNFEKIEKLLSEKEKQGYRLTEVKFSHWYYFTESNSKDANYIFTYDRERKNGLNFDYNLLAEHHANEIKTSFTYFNIYRNIETEDNLNFLKDARADYIKRVLLQNIITDIILLIFGLFCIFADNGSNSKMVFAVILFIILLSTIYYICGYFKQRKTCKTRQKNAGGRGLSPLQ